jgi:D-lactate dehydrogenase (cytochrome)
MRKLRDRAEIAVSAADLLMDESSLSGGWCSEAVWPESEEEARDCMEDFHSRGIPVTLSGALTGVAGGAVPEGGAVISTGALRGVSGEDVPKVLAGTTLDELADWLAGSLPGRFYPPDPTESTASVGGTVATDASGSDSYMYGSTRRWVRSLGLVLPGGRSLKLERGEFGFDGNGVCVHPVTGKLTLPVVENRPPEKNAAGYWMKPGMDLVDLFIGSEGTLGMVTSAELELACEPEYVIDTAVFCDGAGQFWHLFEAMRESDLRLRALEMMDDRCIGFLAENHRGEDLALPVTGGWVLLSRFEADGEEELDAVLEGVESMVEGAGVSPDRVWGGLEPHERQRIRDFRHALPETVNSVVASSREACPGVHKLGTDSAVPVEDLREFHGMITERFAGTGMDFLVFGHAGQGHLHANVLPRDAGEEAVGEQAVLDVSRWAVSRGGTVSAEHGVGRIKSDLLRLMYSDSELEGMGRLRRTIDPDGLLAPAIRWP